MKILVYLKLVAGFIALGLGFVGLAIPVWPTTPFVLIAVGCFSATPALQKWLLKIPFVKEYYESYTVGSGVKTKTVVWSISFLWLMLAISSILSKKLWVAILLIIIGFAVTAHIVYISKKRIA